MPITFDCACGRKIRTADENAGRSARCPACSVQIMVPAAGGPPGPRREAAPDEPGHGFGYNLQSEEVAPAARRAAAPADYDRTGRADRPRPTADRYPDADRFIRRPAPAKRGWTEGGVMAGLGMMFLGALITVGGLAIGWIIFPGPILFVAGLISFIKGVASGNM